MSFFDSLNFIWYWPCFCYENFIDFLFIHIADEVTCKVPTLTEWSCASKKNITLSTKSIYKRYMSSTSLFTPNLRCFLFSRCSIIFYSWKTFHLFNKKDHLFIYELVYFIKLHHFNHNQSWSYQLVLNLKIRE